MEAGIDLRPVSRCLTRTSVRSMVSGMATTKITITLPDDQVHSIRELVAGKETSLCAFVKRLR